MLEFFLIQFINMLSIEGDTNFCLDGGWCHNYYQVNTQFLAMLSLRQRVHERTGYIVKHM